MRLPRKLRYGLGPVPFDAALAYGDWRHLTGSAMRYSLSGHTQSAREMAALARKAYDRIVDAFEEEKRTNA